MSLDNKRAPQVLCTWPVGRPHPPRADNCGNLVGKWRRHLPNCASMHVGADLAEYSYPPPNPHRTRLTALTHWATTGAEIPLPPSSPATQVQLASTRPQIAPKSPPNRSQPLAEGCVWGAAHHLNSRHRVFSQRVSWYGTGTARYPSFCRTRLKEEITATTRQAVISVRSTHS